VKRIMGRDTRVLFNGVDVSDSVLGIPSASISVSELSRITLEMHLHDVTRDGDLLVYHVGGPQCDLPHCVRTERHNHREYLNG
jgi:hypothetical protein